LAKSPPFSDPDDPDLGEVYLELTPMGGSMKVSAIHVQTGIEISAIAPAKAARSDMQRLALGKLRARLKREGHI
jgi:hypothetical protein